jgi:hypothetical protein
MGWIAGYLLRIIGILVVIPLLLIAVFILAISNPGLFAARKNIHYTVELKVGGQPVTIDRTVQCIPDFEGELSNPFKIVYRADRAMLTERLPDGSGVMVIPPNYCFRDFRPLPNQTFPPFIPAVAWVDNVGKPGRIDLYLSRSRLNAVENPVQVQHFSQEVTKSSAEPARAVEFAVMTSHTGVDTDVTITETMNASMFHAVYGDALDIDDDIARLIAEQNPAAREIGILSGYAIEQTWRDRHHFFHLAAILEGNGPIWPDVALGRYVDRDDGLTIVAFNRDAEGRFVPQLDDRGVIRFYAVEKPLTESRVTAVAWKDQTFSAILTDGASLYLPEEKTVMSLRAAGLDLIFVQPPQP